ncbi:MAG: ComEC/Rec2 family competence protein [Anaerobutyricum soehngenii]
MVIGPLLLRFYYQWSPYSVLLNLFVIPAMSPLLLSAITGGVVDCFSYGQAWQDVSPQSYC